jgi:hypothetical protein
MAIAQSATALPASLATPTTAQPTTVVASPARPFPKITAPISVRITNMYQY